MRVAKVVCATVLFLAAASLATTTIVLDWDSKLFCIVVLLSVAGLIVFEDDKNDSKQ